MSAAGDATPAQDDAMPESDAQSRGVHAFLARWCADLEAGRERSLASYQTEYPDAADAIAREWRVLHELDAMGESMASAGAARVVGPYRILSELGRGGQGRVFLAEDTRLPRRVALKVLNAFSALSERSQARFLREAAVASQLEHPSICPVYERGTADGVPYIAMRYVEGESLAERIAAARERGDAIVALPEPDETSSAAPARSRASAPERAALARVLLLVETVARALHEAHEAGFVHRDVKPSNVLVGRDGRPVILDFGLAGARAEGFEELTLSGEIFGTPAYMAPEQVTSRHEAVDRRTDVYALGVTLYECVTLRRPFEGATRAELFRAIEDEEPADARSASSAVSAELAAILARCLEKERDRRYSTALDLAEDLRRLRCDEPVLARPQSELYRLRKLARRHRGLVAGIAIAFAMLALAVAGTSVGLLRALRAEARSAREARKATAVSEFLATMLAAADPAKSGRDVSVIDALALAERELETSFQEEPEIRAKLHAVIGATYANLGDFAASERNLARALAMQETLSAEDDYERIDALHSLGSLYWAMRRLESAEPLLRRAHAGFRRALGASDPSTLTALGTLALVVQTAGRSDEAGEMFLDAYELSTAEHGPEHPVTLSAGNNLARWHETQGDSERAIALLTENVAMRRRVLGEEHPKTLIAIDSLALVLRRAGEPARAEPLFREALGAFERRLGAGHVDTLRCKRMLAACVRDLGREDEAERMLAEASDTARAALPPHQLDALQIRWELAELLRERDRIGEAADAASAALDDALAAEDPARSMVWRLAGTLARALVAMHDEDGARATLERIDPLACAILAERTDESRALANALLPLYERLGPPETESACRAALAAQ